MFNNIAKFNAQTFEQMPQNMNINVSTPYIADIIYII